MTTLDERLAAAQAYYSLMRDMAHGEVGRTKFGEFVAAIEEARKKLCTRFCALSEEQRADEQRTDEDERLT